jgi:hypothetical protein
MIETADERLLKDVFGDIAGAYPALEKPEKPGVVFREDPEDLGTVGFRFTRFRHR